MSKSDLPVGLTQGSAPHIWRYCPSPTRVKQGWKAITLKHASGQHMDKWDAAKAVEQINTLIDDYNAGIPVAGRLWSNLNPKAEAGLTPRPPVASDSIGALLDRYFDSREFTADLRPNTQRSYRQSLKQLVEVLAGHGAGHPEKLDLPFRDKAKAVSRYEADIAAIRALTVHALFVEDNPLAGKDGVYAYFVKRDKVPTANHLMAVTQTWLKWVITELKMRGAVNPATEVKRKATKGRVVIWSKAEETEVIAVANRMGWHNVAWAVELALELSWSQVDVLAITWGQVRDNRVKGTRSKTQNLTHTTLTRSGRDLIGRIKARWHEINGADIEPGPATPLLVVDQIAGCRDCGAVGKPWQLGYFRKIFSSVRSECTPRIEKTFQDLRDTAITRMKEGGLDNHQIQSRSQHSLSQINNILDKHYGMTTLRISDEAARKLDML